MGDSLLIKNAAELLTLKGPRRPRYGKEMSELGIIKGGAVLIKDGLIAAVGKTSDVERTAKKLPKLKTIDASGQVVMPGFVDAHNHLIFAGSREHELELKLEGASYLQILEAGGGILSTVKATRKASKAELVESAMRRLDGMLRFGTTACEAKTGYGLTKKDELKMLDAIKELANKHPMTIVPTFLAAHALPPEYKNDADAYINLIIEEMLPEVASKELAEFCDVFCEKGAFTPDQSKRLLLAAKERNLIPKIHADELSDSEGALIAAQVGAISAEHLLKSSKTGLDAMAKKGVIAVLLPASVYALMLDNNAHANARYMINAGIPIALGTDLCPNCWTESMQFVVSLACFRNKMRPAEAITAATINAAYAINRGSTIGSIEAGKKGDVIILDAPNYKFIPYRFGVNLVDKVIKNGNVVVECGKTKG